MHAAPALPLRCAIMLVGVWAIAVIDRKRSGFPTRPRWLAATAGLVVDFYPMVLIPLVYDVLGFLIPALNPVEKDPILIAADRAMFGVDPTVWLQRFIWPPLTDVLYLAYATFFFFPLIVGIPLWLHSPALGRRFLFTISVAFYVSYTGYIFMPAEGPRVGLAAEQTVQLQQTALSKTVAGTLDDLERNRVDAFPSGHILITTVCLMTAARRFRRLFWCLLPVGLLLMIATVYCRYHYMVDVIAGFALAPFIAPLANWLCDQLAGEKHQAPQTARS